MRARTCITVAAILLLAVALRAGGRAPAPARQAVRAVALPPIVQTCPMHPDVVEEKPGTCPICKMKLVPVRLESVWSCPVHAAITRDAKGRCPVCGRDLVQMTMALSWTCKGRADIDATEPGRCPDGSSMIAKRTLRPHGNHNPQHGGQFFMAPDNQHHLEGTLPTPRLFRVYLYDDYARPLSAVRIRGVSGVVEVSGRAVPLVAAVAGSYLEARIPPARFPARLTAKLHVKKDAPEYRFDFAFATVTTDPGAAVAQRRGATSPAATTPQSLIDPALTQVAVPSTVPEMLAQLRARNAQVKDLIARGNLGAVFVPAFQARDVALALEERLGNLPVHAREVATPAIARLVRAAWQLDAAGDVGNREELQRVYAEFTAAARDLDIAFKDLAP